ncbi:hypothetical protein RI367_008348 [Sorochytrium milnesiophthora]
MWRNKLVHEPKSIGYAMATSEPDLRIRATRTIHIVVFVSVNDLLMTWKDRLRINPAKERGHKFVRKD